MIVLGPCPVKYAREWVATVHRRLKSGLPGAMWCIGLWVDGEMRGLAVVGRPKARMLDAKKRTRIGVQEVLRVAVIEGTRNGCSSLYGACSKAGKAMGLDGMITYIHNDETGVSLRASGWVEDERRTDGGEWDREGRQRELAIDPESKRRWWAAWSKAVQSPRASLNEGRT